jgi:sec-independent protein translocase protein TatA
VSIRPNRSLFHDLVDLVLHRAVGGHRERLGAERLDLPHARVESLAAAGGDDDLRASLPGQAGDGAPEPARGSGDDDHPAGEGSFFANGCEIPARTRSETGYHRRMPNIGPWEIILLLLLALLLFGAKRLPEIGRSLGTGMREFKDSVTGNKPQDTTPELPVAAPSDTAQQTASREETTV